MAGSVKKNKKKSEKDSLTKLGFKTPYKYIHPCLYIYIYTSVGWKVHRLTKILSWNGIKCGLS